MWVFSLFTCTCEDFLFEKVILKEIFCPSEGLLKVPDLVLTEIKLGSDSELKLLIKISRTVYL